MWMPDEDNNSHEVGAENERDESDILENQDETDTGATSRDDLQMGAGSTDLSDENDDGNELDVKTQMDRSLRARDLVDRPELSKHH